MNDQEKTKEETTESIILDETPKEEAPILEEGMSLEEAMKEEETKPDPAEAESGASPEAQPETESEALPEVQPVAESEALPEAQPELEDVSRAGRKKKMVTALAAAAATLLVLLGVYLGDSLYFSNRFLMGTTVNHEKCAGKTIEEVKAMLQEKVEGYVLVLEEADGATEEIRGTDIGIQYNGVDVLEEALEKQNSFAWPAALFKKTDIRARIDFTYDQGKLDELIAQLSCMKAENQVAPVPAAVVYANGAYEIQKEVSGTQIDQEQIYAAIRESVDAIEDRINLREKNCYIAPAYTADSEAVIAAKDELNRYLDAKITYSLGGAEVTLDREIFTPWISVDENMTPAISQEQAKAYAAGTLASTYNTPDRAGTFTCRTMPEQPEKQVTFPNACLGRQVDAAAESEAIVNAIRDGKQITKEPALARQEMAEGQYVWGSTYLEVDLTEQHMWYVVNGEVAFESGVVTGSKSPSRETPVGLFTILEMKRNKTLRGYRPNGTLEYATPVKYWMRVTWSGVGFHDASWNSTAAYSNKTYYVSNGSHGCINMPPAKAGELYGMISVGTPVVIHN